MDREVYHFEFYPLNGKCKGDPLKLEIPTDGGCKVGIKVYHCKEKLCFPEEEDEEDVDWGDVLDVIQQNYDLLEQAGEAVQ